MHADRRRLVAAGAVAVAVLLTRASAAAEPTPAPVGTAAQRRPAAVAATKRIVDPAVAPAVHVRCDACGPSGCRHGHGHHADCRDGHCVPCCPVRPQQFGFYGTRWRRWPGQGVVPVSGERSELPVDPPRSAIPNASEEFLNPPPADLPPPADVPESPAPMPEPTPEPAAPGPTQPAPLPEPPAPRPEPPTPMPEPPAQPPTDPAAGATPKPDPTRPAEPTDPAAPSEPRSPAKPAEPSAPAPLPTTPAQPAPIPEKPSAPAPAPEVKPKPPAEGENLFDVDSGWRARRRFPVSRAPLEPSTADSEVRPTALETPVASPTVPRVPFDPAAETRRLREGR